VGAAVWRSRIKSHGDVHGEPAPRSRLPSVQISDGGQEAAQLLCLKLERGVQLQINSFAWAKLIS